MSHNIEQAKDGSGRAASFVGGDGPAWHRLGTYVTEAKTAEEAGRLAHLSGWDIRQVPLFASDPRNEKAKGLAARTIVVPSRFVGNLRTNPFTGDAEILGVVGQRYEIIQNEEAFAIADDILALAGEAQFSTAASLDDGRRVFMTIKLTGDNGLMIGGEDPHDLYLVIFNSHDGSSAMYAIITPVRVVCQNTLNLAIKTAKRKFIIRHTATAKNRVEEARKALGLTWSYAEEFQKIAEEHLLGVKMSEPDFVSYTKKLVPDPKSKEGKTASEGWLRRAEAARNTMLDIFKNSDTTEFGRGTQWAAYNAATQYADWNRPSKKRDVLALGADADVFKENAFKLLVPASVAA